MSAGILRPEDLLPADEMDVDEGCPVCGADAGQQCMAEDPDNKMLAVELGGHVHAGRVAKTNGWEDSE